MRRVRSIMILLSGFVLGSLVAAEEREFFPRQITIGEATFSNLRLNSDLSERVVFPGERIFATVNVSWNTEELDSLNLHQILVGFEEEGGQKCIFNEPGYRLGDSILAFYLEAPEIPGDYSVLFQVVKAGSRLQAMQLWSAEDSIQGNLGRIIVSETP